MNGQERFSFNQHLFRRKKARRIAACLFWVLSSASAVSAGGMTAVPPAVATPAAAVDGMYDKEKYENSEKNKAEKLDDRTGKEGAYVASGNKKPGSGNIIQSQQGDCAVRCSMIGYRQLAELVSGGDGSLHRFLKYNVALKFAGVQILGYHAFHRFRRMYDNIVCFTGETDRDLINRFRGRDDFLACKAVEAVVEQSARFREAFGERFLSILQRYLVRTEDNTDQRTVVAYCGGNETVTGFFR